MFQSQSQGFLPFPGLLPPIPAFVDCGNSNTFLGIPGPQGPPGPAGALGPVTVTNITTNTYTAINSDYFLCVTSAVPVVITLPTGVLGTVYIIKDCSGTSVSAPITVQGTSENVDAGVATIDSAFSSITVIFNGTNWSIV